MPQARYPTEIPFMCENQFMNTFTLEFTIYV